MKNKWYARVLNFLSRPSMHGPKSRNEDSQRCSCRDPPWRPSWPFGHPKGCVLWYANSLLIFREWDPIFVDPSQPMKKMSQTTWLLGLLSRCFHGDEWPQFHFAQQQSTLTAKWKRRQLTNILQTKLCCSGGITPLLWVSWSTVWVMSDPNYHVSRFCEKQKHTRPM